MKFWAVWIFIIFFPISVVFYLHDIEISKQIIECERKGGTLITLRSGNVCFSNEAFK